MITHTTGIDPLSEGDEGENYLFTLIGTVGETAAHICPANRKKGQTGSCSFKDRSTIGELNALKIKSVVKDGWIIVIMEVQVAGLAGIWRHQGKSQLNHEGTVTLNLVHTSKYL